MRYRSVEITVSQTQTMVETLKQWDTACFRGDVENIYENEPTFLSKILSVRRRVANIAGALTAKTIKC